MNKTLAAMAASAAILGSSFITATPSASAASPVPDYGICYATSIVHESRYKKVIQGEQETSKTEYRFRSRTALYGSKEIKSVEGYDFVDGGTTKVVGKVVAGHWVKSAGFHQIPDVIINIVWGKDGVPERYLGTGSVSLSAYGGPSVTVRYKAEKVETDKEFTDWGPWSDWTTDHPGDTSETRDVDSRQVGNGDGTPDQTVYYRPGGSTSTELGEANWTTDVPGQSWTLIDVRDRETKTSVECPPPAPQAKVVTLKVQVDKYATTTSKLRSKAVGYDNDGLLRKSEDRPHWGKSAWEIVTVTGTTETTESEWLSAINKATKKLPDVSSSSKWTASAATGKKSITVAWIISGDGQPTAWHYKHTKTNVAQRFFASNR